jgi:hypothetical protein
VEIGGEQREEGRRLFRIPGPCCVIWCSACPCSLFLHRLCAGLSRPLNSDRDYQTSELEPPITEPLADYLPRFLVEFVCQCGLLTPTSDLDRLDSPAAGKPERGMNRRLTR